MSEEIVKLYVNNAMSLEYSSDVKEEFQDECYLDNKVCVSETTISDAINISNNDLNECTGNDKIIKYETLSGNINRDIPSYEVNNTISNNVKIENENCPADTQIKFDNELLFCNHCKEVYQDYCSKCRVLVHILNERPCLNTYNRIKELPKYMLEARETSGHLRIFSLKVIPEDVRFGPFNGLNCTGVSLRIKRGRIVVNDDELEHVNWMQYINPARNSYEQNLYPFKHEGKLYYCSTRRIQEGEELLVYFGKEYEDNLLKNVEMDFVPIAKKDVENIFACTFCCLGFSLKAYLAEHKDMCHSESSKMFSVEELMQCQFCKMYLEAKEYFGHHMDYCCETNNRYCVIPMPKIHELEVETRASETHEVKKRKRRIYKCTQCKFRTMYSADFRHHTNEHYKVKMYKCGICHRRYKAKESLKTHVEKFHANNEGRNVHEFSACNYFMVNTKNIKDRSPHSHDCGKHCLSAKCKFQTRGKYHLKSLLKIKRLKRRYYKCAVCEYNTNYKSNLKAHLKVKHLGGIDYKCMECEFETHYKACLEGHIKTQHLKQKDYKCIECEYEINYKAGLDRHIKAQHLKQKDYKCMECQFETNYKACLERHIKTQHLKQKDYKCMECEFKTYFMSSLETHIKTKHLKQENYRCVECEYKSNYKANLQTHIKAKHLKQNYKCLEVNSRHITSQV